mgnify:CR=1 FL=1
MFVEKGGYMKRDGGLSKIVFCIILGLMSFIPEKSYAQSAFYDNYLVNYISMSEGLSANFVDYIYKDSSGFIWIATSGGGLSRYDGKEFLNITTHSTPALSSNFVTCLTEDHFRRLWITTENGLNILDLETLSCNTLSLPLPETQNTGNRIIRFITADTNGNIWTKHGSTIYRISFDTDGEVKDILTFTNPQVGLQDNFIRDVDGDGTVWTSFGAKLVKLQTMDGSITATTIIPSLPIEGNAYVSDCLIKNNEVWVSTESGLLRYNRASGKLRQYQHSPTDDSTLSQNFITALNINSDDQLLVSSLKGLNVYDPFNDCFERINSDAEGPRKTLLSSDFINCISYFDGQIWIGTESAGIVVISPKLLTVKNFVHDDTDSKSIAPNPVNTILADSKGRVWTGNVEAGLSWTYPGSGTFHHFTVRNSGLVHNSVSALECDSEGNLWVGTWGGGISLLSLDNLQFKQNITATPDIPISYVGVLKYDSINNYMWIGSNIGVFVYDPVSKQVLPVLKKQPFGSIGACVDKRGRFWLGCQEGLYVFDLHSRNSTGGSELFSNRVIQPGATSSDRINCISLTSDGTIWVGSNGNGIYRLDREDDSGDMHFTQFSTEQGLANDRVKGILEDNYRNIWISTDNGLSRFNPRAQVFTNYSTSNGLASSQFYWNASARLSDGSLCFGQMKGLTVVTPESEYRSGKDFNLKFTRLTIGEKDIRAGDKPLKKDIAYADIVRLHEKDKSVGLEFALLDYGAASPANYSYRLKGFDDEWIRLRQNRQFISFANLPAGNYSLQIRATDSDTDILGENEIAVTVTGYFYKTWWFILMVIILATAGVYFFVKIRTRNLSRQREELQHMVMERTREISEQKKLLELKAEELASQNRILTRQNEELAGHKILYLQDIHQSDSPKDEQFMKKIIETIRENYKNPNLDVPAFCTALGMSKTLVNKKLQESLGQSIGQFIRTYRLSVAKEMLINNKESRNMNISEIAYEAGFNDPKYFTRCFTKEYGVAPSSFSK